jgi:hypothetical protein
MNDLEKFVHYNNTFNLNFQDKGDYLAGPCFLHGGDNMSALTIYKDTNRFYCWTHSCHLKAQQHNNTIDYLLKSIEFQYKINDAYSIPVDSAASKLTLQLQIGNTPKNKTVDRSLLNGIKVPSTYYMMKGLSKDTLEKYGVGDTSKYHYMSHRAVFPVYYNNQLVGMTGRSIINEEPKWKHKGSIRQYIYGFDFIKNVFDKNSENRTLAITEGPPDALKIIEAGFQAFPLFGCSISSSQLIMLHRLAPSEIILWLDGDSAGQEASVTISKKLSKYYKVSNIVTQKDPDEFSTIQIQEIINECRSK